MVESALPVTASNVERAITSDLPQNQVKVRFLCMRDILCDTVDRHIVFRLVCQIPSLLVLVRALFGEMRNTYARRDKSGIRKIRQRRIRSAMPMYFGMMFRFNFMGSVPPLGAGAAVTSRNNLRCKMVPND